MFVILKNIVFLEPNLVKSDISFFPYNLSFSFLHMSLLCLNINHLQAITATFVFFLMPFSECIMVTISNVCGRQDKVQHVFLGERLGIRNECAAAKPMEEIIPKYDYLQIISVFCDISRYLLTFCFLLEFVFLLIMFRQ